ncbi:MAG: 5'-methylthioadenosine/S-adenosylhomocysteine nucleosidase [Victivallaceae bacterium]|nr:5'-methylthioadenosine/S-adenosylhomocysteine nucleosidase [Victivallaceae bacterium]
MRKFFVAAMLSAAICATAGERIMKKVFVAAMDCEADAVAAHFDDRRESVIFGRRVIEGKIGNEETAVIVSGIGKCNAAAATQCALSSLGAQILINAGVAGGLRQDMRVADIYEVKAAVQYDFDLTQLNGTPMGTLNEYKTPELPLATTGKYPDVILGTGDRFNDNENDYRLLVETFAAGLCDMEGGAVAHVALRAGKPCFMLKCISDVYGSGSTVEQYSKNLSHALKILSAAIPGYFSAVQSCRL